MIVAMSDEFDDETDLPFETSPAAQPVSELVGDEVERVAPDATLREVCAVLSDRGVGIVGIGGEAGRLDGVVSERDIIAALAAGADPDAVTAGDVEVEHIYYVDPSATLEEVAAEMLSKWTRHLFVGEPDRLAGVVSMRDVLGAFAVSNELD